MLKSILRPITAGTNTLLEKTRWSSSRRPVSILTYHSVDNTIGPYSITPKIFLKQMECIFNNYEVIQLDDIHKIFQNSNDKKRRIVITFDDAFKNFYEYALQILKDFTFPCTVFVPAGYIGKTNEWDLPNPEILQRPIMDEDDIKTINEEDIVNIGSHSVEHLDMNKLDKDKAHNQAIESRNKLQELTGKPVTSFAYPFGQLDNYSELSTKILIETGYNIAVTTHWGSYQSIDSIMNLHRICLGESEDTRNIKSIIEGHDDWITIKEKTGFFLRNCKRLISSI